MMINVTLATTAGKSLVTVEGNQTPSQVLEENSVEEYVEVGKLLREDGIL